ncbi:MAG: hypothetical protein KIT73_06095, partial [Burkholderiales bacterium]|nr:hypothetical protein [Burkholderiales bacterium]
SQVNELESLREYSKNVRFPRSGRTSLGEMEVRAIESANAAVPDRTAADIAGELQALDMAALGKVLTATDRRNLDEVVGATTTTLHKSVGSLKETERKTSERITNLKPVNDVLRQLHSQAQDPGSVLCRSSPALSDTGLAALRKTVPGLGVLPPGVTWEDLEPSLPETPGVCTTTWADQCIAPCIRALAEAGEAERVALDRFRTDLSRWQTALERGAARQPLPVKRADFLDQARIEADDDDDLPDQPAADAADKTPPVYRDPRRVLGQLLETLRAELAAELRSNGESKKADNLRLSIRLVDQQRQRFVYIRPAVSYLRNSSPATALQDESSVVWKNLLREHLGRSASQGGPDKDILKVQTAIDKQYWQSVNRIRVAAGPSNINYVLVRDDIGNWYVKSYSSSPDDVFRSALNLGLYAAAGAPGKGAQQVAQTLAAVSVKNSNGELESPIGSSVAGTTVTNQDTLDKLQRRYDKGYWNALRDVCKQLNTTFGRMTGPTGALRSAASNAVKEPQARQHFDTSIDANPSYFFEPDARTKPDVTVCESPDEKRIVGDSGTRIVLLNETHAATVALVKAIQTYGSVVAQGLQAGFDQRAIQFFAGPPPAAAPDYRKDVEAAVKTKTSETIRTALDRLTTVADEYAGNLTFMQGAVGNLPAGETP